MFPNMTELAAWQPLRRLSASPDKSGSGAFITADPTTTYPKDSTFLQ